MKFLYHFVWWLHNLIVVLNVKCAISNMHGISRHEMQKNYDWKNKTGCCEQRVKWYVIMDFWHLNYYKKTLYAIKNCFTYFRTRQLQQKAKTSRSKYIVVNTVWAKFYWQHSFFQQTLWKSGNWWNLVIMNLMFETLLKKRFILRALYLK